MNNESEIARLAVELAKDVEFAAMQVMSDKEHRAALQVFLPKAQGILALAEPQKPKRHQGIDAEPKVEAGYGGYYVRLCGDDAWIVSGPMRSTPAEAIAAWNAMIARITGVDEETVRLMNRVRERIDWEVKHSTNYPPCTLPELIKDITRWLAERKGGGE